MTKPNITVGMLLAITAASLKSPNESTVDDVIARNIQAHKNNPDLDQVLSFSDAVSDRVLELLPADLRASLEAADAGSGDGDGSSSEGDANESGADNAGGEAGSEGSTEGAGSDSEQNSGSDVSAASDAPESSAGDVSAETSAPSQPQPAPAPAPKPQQKLPARK